MPSGLEAAVSQVTIIAKIPAAPGQRDELIAAMQGALDGEKDEAGTRFYILHKDAVDADVLWVYEMYESQEALAEHGGRESFKVAGRAMKPFMGGRPEITFATPIGGKGF